MLPSESMYKGLTAMSGHYGVGQYTSINKW